MWACAPLILSLYQKKVYTVCIDMNVHIGAHVHIFILFWDLMRVWLIMCYPLFIWRVSKTLYIIKFSIQLNSTSFLKNMFPGLFYVIVFDIIPLIMQLKWLLIPSSYIPYSFFYPKMNRRNRLQALEKVVEWIIKFTYSSILHLWHNQTFWISISKILL